MNHGEHILDKIHLSRILPVVRLEEPSKAVMLMKALLKGGLQCIEITFRAAGAEKAIAMISQELPEVIVGAGTVLSIEQVQLAISSGADFIVTPGFDDAVVQYCLKNKILVIPGVCTPSEVMKGLLAGLSVLKFFPAEACGGVGAIKSLAGPFSDVQFIPTGGVNNQNYREYLSLNNVLACGGTWMAKESLINGDCYAEIAERTGQSVNALLEIGLESLVLNPESNFDNRKCTQIVHELLNYVDLTTIGSKVSGSFQSSDGRSSIGKLGDIGLTVANVDHLIEVFRARGHEIDESSCICDAEGTSKVYMKNGFAGFAIHFIRR